MCVCARMCVRYYLRLILRANYLLLHVRTFYKQRPKEHKGVGSVHAFFFFQGCQPLLFKDLTLALQSNKNLLVNWLGSPNFSGFFLLQLNVKSSIFHSLALESSQTCVFVSRQWPGAFCWSRCKGGLLTCSAGVFAVEEKRIKTSPLFTVTAPAVCSTSGV